MDAPVSARTAILLALTGGQGFGLELIERVTEQTKGAVNLGQGSVYPLLRDLEDEGLLRSWEGKPMTERGGRPRRYYALTKAGVRAAREQHAAVVLVGGLFVGGLARAT
jgi:PadR family transcriptional regulator, regulatory protein PadR